MNNMDRVKIVEKELLSDNWYKLHKVTFDLKTKEGDWQRQSRECYDRGNGAVILLFNKANQTVVLTKQFRMPTYVNGNVDGMLIEACAGLLDNQSPEECIKRETEEETGYRIQNVEKIFEAYMSPGSVTEILYFFIAEYEPKMKVSEGGGHEDENENIEVLEIPFAKAVNMIASGEIKDGKTIMLLQYLQISKYID
ncbi:nudix-type nucleoside diphosphatase, YffH/AdpP family [Spirosomataceae bacterium TFI 002]|nr:nudix-type nucleoside diphosphatase, YffH/AdpP family [Spirosomataceae bacterium TFI 002]